MIQNRRRQRVMEELGFIDAKEEARLAHAREKEEKRQQRKQNKRRELENSASYRAVVGISRLCDTWMLDPIIGFFGVGDILTTMLAFPSIYVSLFKIRSIPLTLACIFNTTLDFLLGSIPFFIGDICDIFYRSFRKNLKLIQGFVEDDRAVIAEVNRKAIWMFLGIALVGLLIYWFLKALSSVMTELSHWIGSWF